MKLLLLVVLATVACKFHHFYVTVQAMKAVPTFEDECLSMNSNSTADDYRTGAMYDRGFCHVAHCTLTVMTQATALARCQNMSAAFVYNVLHL